MDCGPACIRMLASAYGKIFPLGWLRTQSCLTREGVSVAGIRHALNSIRMDSAAFSLTLDELEEKCPLPAILHWNQNHFVILESVRRNRRGVRRWRIADPAFGRYTASDYDMRCHWLAGERGVVVAAEPDDDFAQQQPPDEFHSFIAFARRHVWAYRRTMLKSVAIMVIGTLLSLLLPLLTQAMVDNGINGHDPNLVLLILMAQLAILLGSFAMQYIGSRVALYMSTHISISIISAYLEKLLKLPMTFFDTKSPGDYQQRIVDHSRLQSFMTVDSLQTLFALFSVPFYLVIVYSYSLVALVIYLIFTLMSVAWSAWFLHLRKVLDFEQFQLNARAQNCIYEMTNCIVDIKVNAMDSYKIAQWNAIQNEQYGLSRRILRINQSQSIGFSAISQLRNLVILCWVAMQVIDGAMTLGMMMSISVIIGMISGPLSQVIDFMRRLQDARISLERSDEVSAAPDEDRQEMLDVPRDKPMDISLRGVTFAYGGEIGRPAVENVTIDIPAGSFTAIVGESGSGKTTLMKLLLKFYEPRDGKILLAGIDLQDYSAASLRSASGVVMQENALFSDTVANNISLGDQSHGNARLENAIALASLEGFVTARPLGVHTMVGAEGEGLSGGERQRVMLARVAYKSPVYMFLDEATSALDAETERTITDNFAARFRTCTRIVIAHRLSTVRAADQIVVMRHGRIVETGTHEQLIAAGGYYLQMIGNQLELAGE